MIPQAFTVFVGEPTWRVAVCRQSEVELRDVPAPAEPSLASWAAQARELLTQWGYDAQPTVVALPSSWCLAAVISTRDLDRGGRRKAMTYRLEEHLPISSEQVIADYVEFEPGHALGVCAEVSRLRELVDALQGAGIDVRFLCPAAMLAAAHAAARSEQAQGVLLATGGHPPSSPTKYDLIQMQGNMPARWWWLADDQAAVRTHLQASARDLTAPLTVATLGVNGAPTAPLGLDRALRIEIPDLTLEQAAALQAARLLDDSLTPWIDLRRDALAAPARREVYRRPTAALAIAAVLLAACVVGASLWRGEQYRRLTLAHRAEQVELFKAAFPEQRVPGNIVARLTSERQRLAALGGRDAGSDAHAQLQSISALEHLATVLRSLPADLRFKLLDLGISGQTIRLDGQALDHAGAEQLAASLRNTGRYEVEPPRTQALRDRGVSFTFAAKPLAPAAGEAQP